MPRSGQRTRQRILDAAYGLFRRKGFTRAGMDDIAAATGVTKRTLYHHFESKDALLAAVLDAQHELALAAFKTFGDRMAGSPEQMVGAMFEDLAVWSDRPRWAGSGFTRLVVELADLPGHPARLVARRHKALLERHLADLLAQAGIVRPTDIAREIWLLSEGAITMMLVHGDRGYAAAAARAAQTLLHRSAETPRSTSGVVPEVALAYRCPCLPRATTDDLTSRARNSADRIYFTLVALIGGALLIYFAWCRWSASTSPSIST